MQTLDSMGMTYDAFGREVEMTSGSTNTQFVYALGRQLAIMNGQTENHAFVPLVPGTDVRYNASGIVSYRIFDWRGNKIAASSTTRTYNFGADYAPFGETEWSTGGGDQTFGEMTNATVSDEYDALARKQHPVQGRWVSPDPAGLSAVDPTNPQTWNRYAYVANSPLDTTDPSGQFCLTVPGGSGCSTSGGEPIDPNAGCYAPAFCDFVNFVHGAVAVIAQEQESSVGPGFSLGNSILPGENSLNFPLGPSPLQILNDILTGNFADLLGINVNNCNPICDSGTNASHAADSTLDNRANALAQAINNTGVQTLQNPCTLGLWYGASTSAAIGASVVSDGAVFPEIAETVQNVAVKYNTAPSDVRKLVNQAVSLLAWAATKVDSGCNAMENW